MELLRGICKLICQNKARSALLLGALLIFVTFCFMYVGGNINPFYSGMSIKPQSAQINQNETTKIIKKVGFIPFYTKKDMVYESKNPGIATVSDDGIVTGISNGVAVINLTVRGITAQTQVYVTENAVVHYDKGVYIGGVKNGKRNGYGVMKYENGNVYKGSWKDDTPNGYGVMTWKNKNRYEGEWKDEQFDGFGRLEYKNSYTYTGGWLKGGFHGYGEIKWKNKDEYKGEWKNGQMNGYGVFSWYSGDRYFGQWLDGNRSGYGEFIFSRDRSRYVGYWAQNLREGYGVEYISGKLRYEGEWTKNMYEGIGRLYIDGTTIDYEGEFKNNKPVFK
ncbi:MAG: MORN repeat protein [Firmicutes bacterium ADurb.Bin193]|nr:MAG: MORN repeat protein [Firmicutes bacterium ADurb.Bin193]